MCFGKAKARVGEGEHQKPQPRLRSAKGEGETNRGQVMTPAGIDDTVVRGRGEGKMGYGLGGRWWNLVLFTFLIFNAAPRESG